ncbi:DUF3265 domain-containing protein [Vibrio antiquarius]|nr:DUF3265 domain-containing protein [Vibrio antiquarius]MCS0021862.1 DUF3265 domain-containing protein [Vibrio antiquarius]
MGKLFNLYGQYTTSFTRAKCRVGFNHAHNKLFKRDSQLVAFLLCVGFSVYGGMRWLRYFVAHPLTGR